MNLLLSTPSGAANSAKNTGDAALDFGSKEKMNSSSDKSDFGKAFDRERSAIKNDRDKGRSESNARDTQHSDTKQRDTKKTDTKSEREPVSKNNQEAAGKTKNDSQNHNDDSADKTADGNDHVAPEKTQQTEKTPHTVVAEQHDKTLKTDAAKKEDSDISGSILLTQITKTDTDAVGAKGSSALLSTSANTASHSPVLNELAKAQASALAIGNGESETQTQSPVIPKSVLGHLSSHGMGGLDSAGMESAEAHSVDNATQDGLKQSNKQWLAQAADLSRPGSLDKPALATGQLNKTLDGELVNGSVADSANGQKVDDTLALTEKATSNTDATMKAMLSANSAGNKNAPSTTNADMALLLENSTETSVKEQIENAANKTVSLTAGSHFANNIGINVAGAKPVFPVNVTFGKPEWAGMVAERSAMMAAQSIKFAELQLDPPELGPMQVKVSINHDNQASITFIAANPHVREALDMTSARLREMLQEQGVDLVDVDVSDQQSFTQDNTGEQEGRQAHESSPDDALFNDEPASQKWMVSAHTGVDYYA